EVLQVDGHEVSNNMDVIQWVKQAMETVWTLQGGGGRIRKATVRKQVIQYLPKEYLQQLDREVDSIEAELETLEQHARNPRADRQALSAQGQALLARIEKLIDEFKQARSQAYENAYRAT